MTGWGQSGTMEFMLSWEECAELTNLLPNETAALGGRIPAWDFLDFVMAPYLYEEPLKDKPGVQGFIRDDISAAQRRGSYDLSALLKIGIHQRLIDQGYAGELPTMKLARS